MTNQQKTYLLLTGVIIVWGVIGYQIFSQLNPAEKELLINKESYNYTPKIIVEKETYIVKANYRDPFLGKVYSKSKKSKMITPKKKEVIVFPSVIYNGFIDGEKGKSYIITVNGKQEMLKLNQTFENITLLKANNKEATIKFKNVVKKIQYSNVDL